MFQEVKKMNIKEELEFIKREKEALREEKLQFDAQKEEYEETQEMEVLEQMYNDECMYSYDEDEGED